MRPDASFLAEFVVDVNLLTWDPGNDAIDLTKKVLEVMAPDRDATDGIIKHMDECTRITRLHWHGEGKNRYVYLSLSSLSLSLCVCVCVDNENVTEQRIHEILPLGVVLGNRPKNGFVQCCVDAKRTMNSNHTQYE